MMWACLPMSLVNSVGPFHHKHLLGSSTPLHEHEGMSAALIDPGQNLQLSLFESFRISAVLCCTYCFQGRKFLIQHNVVYESTQ